MSPIPNQSPRQKKIKDKDDLEYPKVESKKDILSNIKETIAEEDENYNAPPKRKKYIIN